MQQEQLVFHIIPFCSGKNMLCFSILLFEMSLSFPFLYLLLNCPFYFSPLSSALLSYLFPIWYGLLPAVRERCSILLHGSFFVSICYVTARRTLQGDGSACSCHSSMQPVSKAKLSMLLDFWQISLTPLRIEVTCLKRCLILRVEKDGINQVATRWNKFSPV